MALSIEEKYDEIRQLITMGKEKGYLLYEEVNEMLPADISSSDEPFCAASVFTWLLAAVSGVNSSRMVSADAPLTRQF